MGCSTNGEGGYLCDTVIDDVTEYLDKHFGPFDEDTSDIDDILTNKKMFMELYNKVKGKWFREQSGEDRDMTIREFIGHLAYYYDVPMTSVKTPAFAQGIDKQEPVPQGIPQQGMPHMKFHQTGEPDLTDEIRRLL